MKFDRNMETNIKVSPPRNSQFLVKKKRPLTAVNRKNNLQKFWSPITHEGLKISFHF